MRKIISFSLWGNNQCYNYGALENAYLAYKIYPGWICRFYVSKNILKNVKNQLEKLDNTELIIMENIPKQKKTIWRFIPAFEKDVDIVIVRDTDSRINIKEKLAVDEWLNSNKDFHIMRDAKGSHHSRIMAGMWGVRNGLLLPVKKQFYEFYNNDNTDVNYNCDQNFLAKIIYPLIKNNAIIHDSYHEFKDEIITPFPKNNYKDFIGSIICNQFDNVNKGLGLNLENVDRERTESFLNYEKKDTDLGLIIIILIGLIFISYKLYYHPQ